MLVCATTKWESELPQIMEVLDIINRNHYGTAVEVLGIYKADLEVKRFADGEILPIFNESIRDQDLCIVGSTDQPHDNLFEVLLIADAARRSGARRICLINPYYGYARQDRRGESRCSHGSKMVANLMEIAGIDQIVTFDIHALQIDGNFNIPFTNITVDKIFNNTLIERFGKDPEDLVLCSPDAGGMKRVELVNSIFTKPREVVTILKRRTEANKVDSMQLIGDVRGKVVLIIDDILDTGGTLCKAVDYLLDEGAVAVHACITHGLLSRDACKSIAHSKLKTLILTTSIPSVREKCKEIREHQRQKIETQRLNKAEIFLMTDLGIVNMNGKIASVLYKLKNSMSLK
jgi:ribose-phosphate pyrophosphokinase